MKNGVRAKVEHPFRGHQVPVRLYQSALPGTGQEHGATVCAVCAVQFVDGAQAIDGGTGNEYVCSAGER